MGRLQLVDPEEPWAWDVGENLLRESLQLTGSFGDGLRVFAKKVLREKALADLPIFSTVRYALHLAIILATALKSI